MNYADVTARVNNKKAVVSDFSGINRYSGQRGLKDCENLCASEMPFLAVRGRRAALRALSSPQGIYADDTLAYVDGNRLYYGALEVSGLYLSSGEKQILRLGKYLIVLPDEVYCNTQDISDCGSMSAYFSSETGVSVSCVDEELSPILSYGVTTDEPDGANIGEYCAIKNDDGTYVIMQFDGNVWNEIKSYIKIAGSGIGAGFNVGDTVHCSGLGNVIGNHFTVTHKTADALFCEGAIAAAFTAMSVSIQRIFPRFDFCTVSEGRIYGVRRGRDKGGDFVSRIYASAKNDPFNYSPYCGGMYADVDISGAFTALCDRVGTPIAFSESDIVEIHSSGGWLYPHVIHCYGVESGAHKSAVCDSGIIYYKSSVGVCAYDGSYPECISGSLGRKLKCSEEGSPAICVGGK